MEFAASARKHGVSEEDALHAVENAMVASEQYYDGENRMLIVGPDRSGRMLEVVIVPWRHPELIIHADLMRTKFRDLLRREGRHS
jgi:uncharacterized DUF497 family protein